MPYNVRKPKTAAINSVLNAQFKAMRKLRGNKGLNMVLEAQRHNIDLIVRRIEDQIKLLMDKKREGERKIEAEIDKWEHHVRKLRELKEREEDNFDKRVRELEKQKDHYEHLIK